MKRYFSHLPLFFLLASLAVHTAFGQGTVQPIPVSVKDQPAVQAVYSGHASTAQIRQVQHQQAPGVPTEPLPISPQILLVSDNGTLTPGNVVPAAQPQFVNPNPGFRVPLTNNDSPVPLPQAATPNRPVASENVLNNHRLQNVSPQILEARLVEKLNQRFVPVKNVDGTENLARFRLPVRDGTDVELAIDRQNSIVTIFGSPPMVAACVHLVRLLDVPEGNNAVALEIVPVQRANLVPVRQATETILRETQREATERPAAAQPVPSPNFQRPVDEATAQFTPPGDQPLPDAVRTPRPIVGPLRMDIVDVMDIVVLRGTREEVDEIVRTLEQIELMSREHEPHIELVEMKHADSFRVSQIVQQLYQVVYQQQRGAITMLPLVKPNTILLIGKKESIDTAKELIAKLDTPVDPETQFLVLKLKNATANNVQTYLTNFYTNRPNLGAQVLVVGDFRTNSIIVQASPRDMAEVIALVKQLDGTSDAVNMVKTFQLRNAMATELATTLQNALTAAVPGAAGLGGAAAQQNQGRSPNLEFRDVPRAGVLTDIRITADARSNTIIVNAPTETMPLIEALIVELDQLPSAEAQIKIFRIANGDATTLMNVLQTLFQPTTATPGVGVAAGTSGIATLRPGIDEGESTLVSVRFAADIRTNSIAAIGSAGDMSTVEAILLRLDEENANNRQVMLFKLVNKPADEIAPVLQQYLTGERQLEIQNTGVFYPQSPQEQYRKEVVIVPEPLTNSLIVSSTPRYVEQIRKLVRELDERPLMVAIQVLIAEVLLSKNHEFGVELGLQDSLLFDRGILSGAAAGTTGNPSFLFGDPTLGLPLGNASTGTVGSQGITSFNVGRSGSSAGVGGFTFSASSESLSILIRALETDSRVRVLSRPQVTTVHNLRASIQIGQKVPYVTGTNTQIGGTTSNTTNYLDVGVILDVTPRITPDNMIIMDIYAEKSRVGDVADGIPIGSAGNVPLLSPKIHLTKAQTTVNAMDGQTIVFAGLITEHKEKEHRSIPFLNKIPVVKHLFEYTANSSERTEMLIVMTPTIIRSEREMELLQQQESSRMNWCLSDVIKLTGNSNMRLRTDDWSDCVDTQIIYGTPAQPDDWLLPNDEKIRRELPMPALAPREN